MKRNLRTTLLSASAALMLFSCQRTDVKPDLTAATTDASTLAKSTCSGCPSPEEPQPPITGGCGPYQVTLESKTANGDGTYTWTWSIKNPNPGNGSNGTVQDLSHWSITLNNCFCASCGTSSGAKLSDVVSAATSTNGTSWSSFTPTVQVDPSLKKCVANAAPTLKFDVGTSGSAKTYYRLVLSSDFEIVTGSGPATTSYYKSGSKTGCGTMCFPAIGCKK